MSEPTKAVFLSYARDDAAAARRIAEALRSAGLEVWFDENELRGGDQWDAKIRKQIDACTLFLPIISTHTQERAKGYFRLEWKLAVDQTHLLAEGVPFLAPVVIDDTKESAAVVPPEFMKVQWTRIPGALPTPDFVAQVKRLMEGKVAVARVSRPVISEPTGRETRATGKPAIPRWTWGALTAVVVGIGVSVSVARKPEPAATPDPKSQTPDPKSLSPSLAPAPTAAAAQPPLDFASAKSIAVLPFTNMSEEKEANAFFADGIHEDILTNLALIRELRVVSRTTVMAYRDTGKAMKQIAAELGVTYILEGSVRRSGNKVRVTGQLIHAATDEHVWAKSYDRDLTDIFTIQSELSSQIAGALKAALSPEEKALIARKPTENPAAYDLFLRARDEYNRRGWRTVSSRLRRINLLQSAVDLDPVFAQAWSELASACAFAYFGYLEGGGDYLARAKAAIERAVQLAPDDPVVIANLGAYYLYGYRDYARATEQYERLARQQPNSPIVFNFLGLILRRQGRWVESLACSRRASELDPANISYLQNLLNPLQAGRRWDEALVVQRRIVTLLPDSLEAGFHLASMPYLATGSRREGNAFFARLKPDQLNSPLGISLRGRWAWLTNDLAESSRLDQLQPYYDVGGTPHARQAVLAAIVYYLLGDRQAAQARLGEFPAELRRRLIAEPTNPGVWRDLALVEIILRHPAEAMRCAEQAVALLPDSRDAVDGPLLAVWRSFIYDQAGEHEKALAEMVRLVRVPGGLTVPQLKGENKFISATLRNDPRFQALLNDPKNNGPLF